MFHGENSTKGDNCFMSGSSGMCVGTSEKFAAEHQLSSTLGRFRLHVTTLACEPFAF